MRRTFLILVAVFTGSTIVGCGGSNQVASSTPIIESSADYQAPVVTESEYDLFAMQEEACSQPGARNRDIVIDGITFHCFQ